MAVLQFLLLFLVLGPLVGKRLIARFRLENAAPAPDERSGYRLQQNPFRCGLNDGLGAVFDVELLPQPRGDDDLALVVNQTESDFSVMPMARNLTFVTKSVNREYGKKCCLLLDMQDFAQPAESWSTFCPN
jgi:hypothetical protein